MNNPEAEVPRAMIGAISIGLAAAMCFLISVLFCITNIDEVSAEKQHHRRNVVREETDPRTKKVIETPTGVPILAIFYQATGSRAAATALTMFIVVSLFFAVTT